MIEQDPVRAVNRPYRVLSIIPTHGRPATQSGAPEEHETSSLRIRGVPASRNHDGRVRPRVRRDRGWSSRSRGRLRAHALHRVESREHRTGFRQSADRGSSDELPLSIRLRLRGREHRRPRRRRSCRRVLRRRAGGERPVPPACARRGGSGGWIEIRPGAGVPDRRRVRVGDRRVAGRHRRRWRPRHLRVQLRRSEPALHQSLDPRQS